jgi:hypothetical protein
MEVTSKVWSERKEVLGTSRNSEFPSSGCEARPAKEQSRRPVASLATARVTATAIRRCAKTWAVGMQLRNHHHPGAQGVMVLEGSSAASVREDEGSVQPAECSTTARVQEDGPVIWEALPLLHEISGDWGPGDQISDGRASVRARATRRRISSARGGRPEQGEPERGRDGVQGVGGPNRSDDVGERLAPGPDRAKAARADVSFWRET